MDIRLFDGPIKTSDAQHRYVLTKVGAAAGRLKDQSPTIEVRLSDLNGPKGGVDKLCSIVARAPGLSPLRVEEVASGFYSAIDAASATLKRSLAKQLELGKANGPR